MKKILLVLICICLSNSAFAIDKYSQEYLKNNKHFAVMNPLVEGIAERVIKGELKKQTGARFKVKFEGYTFSSMKKGVFKHLELEGKNIVSNDIPIPYVHLKSLDDYNYVDITKNPVVFKSDMNFAYDMLLSEESMNKALQNPNYQTVIKNLNKLASPMFEVKGVSTKIIDNKMYIVTEYNFPIAPSARNKFFVASSNFEVNNGKIRAVDVKLDSAYGKISLNKVANLLNLLNPLEFTLELLDNKQCKACVENVKIVDNNVKVNGRIFIKGD